MSAGDVVVLEEFAAREDGVSRAELEAVGPDPGVTEFVGAPPVGYVEGWEAAEANVVEAAPEGAVRVGEVEPAGVLGQNDTVAAGQLLGGVGSGAGEVAEVVVEGSIHGWQRGPFDRPVAGRSVERNGGGVDDGSIGLANPTGLVAGARLRFEGFLGDGTRFVSGDVDFFEVGEVAAGTVISADLIHPGVDLDSVVAVWDESGGLVAVDDDSGGESGYVVVEAPVSGRFFVSVSAFNFEASSLPRDPFDPASMNGGYPTVQTGGYWLDIGVGAPLGDTDTFLVDLRPGDVVRQVPVAGTRRFSTALIDPTGQIWKSGDGGVIVGGVDRAGTWAIQVSGVWSAAPGPYELGLRLERPGQQARADGGGQVVFVDFDGAEVEMADFTGDDRTAEFSPLSDHLGGWGLGAGDEDAVIDAVMAVVEENLEADLRGMWNGDRDATGTAGGFDIEVRNSRDHPDAWGDPDVARVVVGGDFAECQCGAVYGMAEDTDLGNHITNDQAFVVLEAFSDADAIPRGPATTVIDAVGAAVGTLVSHEAGHLLGASHTHPGTGTTSSPGNSPPSVMDFGPGSHLMENLTGAGRDRVLGTGDDIDVDFAPDKTHGGTAGGYEHYGPTVAFALSTGQARPDLPVCTISGTPGPDVLVGTEGPDVICGRGGDDRVAGRGGDDLILGGPGDDTIRGGAGGDIVRGGLGDDRLDGRTGADRLAGGPGGDWVTGGPGGDHLYGQDGPDTLRGGVGDDRVTGGPGDLSVDGGAGADHCFPNGAVPAPTCETVW